MHPELFTIPFTELTIKSYGLMMVVGFMTAVWIIRRLSRKITPDPQLITNAALYSLIAGVTGARLFFVIHYFDRFEDDLLSVFAIWQGGLELLGGVLLAIAVIISYMLYHKLPVRQYLDILAVGLMAALVFGRIGCLLNGCCYGKPTDLAWGVRFPYASDAYQSQVRGNPKRNRPEPYIELPDEYFLYSHGYIYEDPDYVPLKPFESLMPFQQEAVTTGPYRCLPVHPTQIYSSLNAAFICLMLFLFWRRVQKADADPENKRKFLVAPGTTFALMFILYAITRFCIEFVRDDNPYEFTGLTVSQNIGIGLATLGVIMMVSFSQYQRIKLKKQPVEQPQHHQ